MMMSADTWAEKSLLLEELDAASRALSGAQARFDVASQLKRDAHEAMVQAEERRDMLQDAIYGSPEDGGE